MIPPWTPQYTLAARITDQPTRFVCNRPSFFPFQCTLLVVDPGTGVVASTLVAVKPDGPASPFPYGFGVIPDRPLIISV